MLIVILLAVKTCKWSKEPMNSLVGRLGVGLGKDVGKTSFYAKVITCT